MRLPRIWSEFGFQTAVLFLLDGLANVIDFFFHFWMGRVLIPARVREAAGMTGDVDILGQVDHLEVWNHDRFVAKLQREPFSEAAFMSLLGLARKGIGELIQLQKRAAGIT